MRPRRASPSLPGWVAEVVLEELAPCTTRTLAVCVDAPRPDVQPVVEDQGPRGAAGIIANLANRPSRGARPSARPSPKGRPRAPFYQSLGDAGRVSTATPIACRSRGTTGRTASKNSRRPAASRHPVRPAPRRFPMTRRPRRSMRVCPSSTRAACGPNRARAAIFVACRAATGARRRRPRPLCFVTLSSGTGRARGDLLRRVLAVEDGAADCAEIAQSLRVRAACHHVVRAALRPSGGLE